MDIKVSQRIKDLGLVFPPAPKPAGVYRPILVIDKFLYVSGQSPMNYDGQLMKGRAGDDLTVLLLQATGTSTRWKDNLLAVFRLLRSVRDRTLWNDPGLIEQHAG